MKYILFATISIIQLTYCIAQDNPNRLSQLQLIEQRIERMERTIDSLRLQIKLEQNCNARFKGFLGMAIAGGILLTASAIMLPIGGKFAEQSSSSWGDPLGLISVGSASLAIGIPITIIGGVNAGRYNKLRKVKLGLAYNGNQLGVAVMF